jgi:hypothetical protein
MSISNDYKSKIIHPNKKSILLVNNSYKEAVFVKFKDLLNWDFITLKGFQYDSVTNNDIALCLNNPDLNKINISLDWEDDQYLFNAKHIENNLKHAMRIAALIVEFNKPDSSIEPVDIDTVSVNQCLSAITNGHHRIRALQYLGYNGFPSYLSGYCSMLEELKHFKLK